MNWGYKIMFVYVGFVLFMLSMVYVASRQTNDMQDENYYVKELQYEDVINGKNNLSKIEEKVSLLDSADVIRIKIPQESVSAATEGNIRFLKPSDKKKDFSSTLQVSEDGIQCIPKSSLAAGMYTVQLNWKANGNLYYHEQPFSVEQ